MNAPLTRGESFAWQIPERFNMGEACADVQSPDRIAVIEFDLDGSHRRFTYGELRDMSDRLANVLVRLGIAPGERVAILIPQSFSAAVAHIGVYKAGLVAVPLSQLFGHDALQHRIIDSGARVVLAHEALGPLVGEIAAQAGARLITVGDELDELLSAADGVRPPATTSADSPALIIYTSGTTAAPKGALHAHRVLFGHLPGFELSHDFFPQGGDVFWTPADWAWIGGLMDALMPTLYFGRPIVASPPGRFDPEVAVRVMVELDVRNVFLPPTALRMLRQGNVDVSRTALRSVMSGGESLDAATLDWFREETGLTIAEIYGQTEANYLVGNCPSRYPVKPGSMGRPYPGHEVVTIDEDGRVVGPDEVGEIALGTPDPVQFLGYWNQPAATEAKFAGRWLRTGDLATVDEDGYVWFKGRADDLIISAGYRIAPVEVEACLLQHPSVGACAVIGIPDEVRGEIVKAYVVPAHGVRPTAEELRAHVRTRLAAYEAPREFEFVDELPLTVTGKVRRRDLADRNAVQSSASVTR